MRVHRVALAVVGMLIAASSLTAQAAIREYGGKRNGKAIGYVSIVDAHAKPFASEVTAPAGDKTRGGIAALSLENEMTIPHDPSTGQARGARQHSPIVFTHEVGPASPQLLHAAETHELLKTVTITIYKPSPTEAESKHFVLTLTGATVIGLRQYTEDGKFLEDVSLAFQKLKLESNANTSEEVEWRAK
jgi:type VI secretion system secreted protein Hcp